MHKHYLHTHTQTQEHKHAGAEILVALELPVWDPWFTLSLNRIEVKYMKLIRGQNSDFVLMLIVVISRVKYTSILSSPAWWEHG